MPYFKRVFTLLKEPYNIILNDCFAVNLRGLNRPITPFLNFGRCSILWQINVMCLIKSD